MAKAEVVVKDPSVLRRGRRERELLTIWAARPAAADVRSSRRVAENGRGTMEVEQGDKLPSLRVRGERGRGGERRIRCSCDGLGTVIAAVADPDFRTGSFVGRGKRAEQQQ